MRRAPALPVSLGLTVLKEGLAKRAHPFGLLGPCPPDKLGVANRAVGADVCGDGEIIYGANRGGLLRHLTRMLPHAKISFVSRGVESPPTAHVTDAGSNLA
jgi:hypothetical protein